MASDWLVSGVWMAAFCGFSCRGFGLLVAQLFILQEGFVVGGREQFGAVLSFFQNVRLLLTLGTCFWNVYEASILIKL